MIDQLLFVLIIINAIVIVSFFSAADYHNVVFAAFLLFCFFLIFTFLSGYAKIPALISIFLALAGWRRFRKRKIEQSKNDDRVIRKYAGLFAAGASGIYWFAAVLPQLKGNLPLLSPDSPPPVESLLAIQLDAAGHPFAALYFSIVLILVIAASAVRAAQKSRRPLP